MRLRWYIYAVAYAICWLLSMLLAPFLPIFAAARCGRCNNNGRFSCDEWRLPAWLGWFQTPDNSLWGDDHWQINRDAITYWSMVQWLWRNPAYGFAWGPFSCKEGQGWQWEGERGPFRLRFGWLLSNPQEGKCMYLLSIRKLKDG